MEKLLYSMPLLVSVGDMIGMKPLSKNVNNSLRNVKCPVCGSTNWYRKKNKMFVCKKCGEEFEDGKE